MLRGLVMGKAISSRIRSGAPRLLLMSFRLFYAVVILMELCIIDQADVMAQNFAAENYYTAQRDAARLQLTLARMHEMNERRIAEQGERFLENVEPAGTPLHFAMQEYVLATSWIQWPILNVTPLAPPWETLKEPETGARPCSLTVRQELGNGVKLADALCRDPIVLGPVRFIAPDFYLPEGLDRQYRFWFIVYALMSAQNFAIHSRSHPGVIFEIVDTRATALPGSNSPGAEGARTISARVAYYTDLLHKMQALANGHKAFTQPDMKRIAQMMSHVSQKNKFATAANELRVQRGQREFLQRGLSDASLYMPWIEKEFISAGVPMELAALAFVESSFNIDAVSKVGASGVFQIMPYVGRGYDMVVKTEIDERNDPVKSARVAAQILKDYYERTGAWPLAVTAYNHGITSLLTAMNKLQTHDLGDIIKGYEKASFGFASKNYYTCFLAMLAVLHDRDLYFPYIESAYPVSFATVTLPQPAKVSELMAAYHFDREQLIFLNPDISVAFIDENGTLPANYQLKVPPHRLLQLVMKSSGEEKRAALNANPMQ